MNDQQERIGIVFGCYAPLHEGHLDCIFKAKKECEKGVIIIVCGSDDDRGVKLGMPLEERFQIIKEYFNDDPLVYVYKIDDSVLELPEYPYGWDKWLDEVNRIYSLDNYTNYKRIWYVGEPDYKKRLEERNEVVKLLDRSKNPISATKIRTSPLKYWNKIIYPFRKYFSHNILITGTASEGKTTLVQDLSKYFNTTSSVEYGREVLENEMFDETKMDINDFSRFLVSQYELTLKKIASKENSGVFFGDTDNLVTQMYAKYYAEDKNFTFSIEDYKIVSKMANEYNSLYKWDKIFLIIPHGKFIDDGVRYLGHSSLKSRWEMHEILISLLKNALLWDKVEILDGNYYENFIKVVNYVRKIK